MWKQPQTIQNQGYDCVIMKINLEKPEEDSICPFVGWFLIYMASSVVYKAYENGVTLLVKIRETK